MTSAYLPAILVPLVGIIFPGLSMALLFLYIEEENIT
uniref:Photosystem I reaction center subunit VIII n=1 Tax=Antithamnionella ternifolia TaxID=207919 RepID=A0A4D6WKW5_9FLOR|nr:photosystem I reaction center subunit VIII [Antithamnionella ternifolia]